MKWMTVDANGRWIAFARDAQSQKKNAVAAVAVRAGRRGARSQGSRTAREAAAVAASGSPELWANLL